MEKEKSQRLFLKLIILKNFLSMRRNSLVHSLYVSSFNRTAIGSRLYWCISRVTNRLTQSRNCAVSSKMGLELATLWNSTYCVAWTLPSLVIQNDHILFKHFLFTRNITFVFRALQLRSMYTLSNYCCSWRLHQFIVEGGLRENVMFLWYVETVCKALYEQNLCIVTFDKQFQTKQSIK